MEYEKTVEGLNDQSNMLDGQISIEEAISIVSDFTGIESTILKEGVEKYSLVEVIEQPYLLKITEEQRGRLNNLRNIIDYRTGVDQ